jgi:predicted RecA/RadA family phage recombinase
MDNYIQPGKVVTLTAPLGGVVSGKFYQIGQLVVCASGTAKIGEKFEASLEGVYTAPKATGQVWSEGAILYFDDAAGKFTTVAEGNLRSGCAVAAAGSSDATGSVRLDGIARENEAT